MTRKQIEGLKAGGLLTDGRGRWVEIADTGRLEQFGDVEVYEMEPDENGTIQRVDNVTVLLTVREMEKFN